MRFLTISLIVSLLAFSVSINAREHTIFCGFAYWDSEAVQTDITGQPSDDEQNGSDGNTEIKNVISTGARSGFGLFYQSFEDDGLYFGVGFQRAEGDNTLCIVEDCINSTTNVDDVNLELGWSLRQWVPFVDFIRSETQTDTSGVIDTQEDWDVGIGSWYLPNDFSKLKVNFTGLKENDRQTLHAGFQRRLQNDFTIGLFFSYPIDEDISGYGLKFTLGWTL